ncbi:MAG: ABC transporter ATP-binding protein [Anaerolineaceae bacterium]|jgi:ATP-binding cassette subfamily B protein
MGFFEGLDAEAYDRKYSDRALIGRILTYFKPQARRMVLVIVMAVIISVLGAGMPVVVSNGMNLLQVQPTSANILLLSGIVLALGVFMWVANWVSRRQAVQAIAGVVVQLARDAFHSSVDHDLSFYDEYSSGRIVSRITSDTQDFGQLVTIITDAISQVLESIILGVVLFNTEYHLALLVFALIPLVFVFAIAYRGLARRVTQQGMRAMANVNSTIKETVSGIAVAKNFRQEGSIYVEFDDANKLSYRVNWKRGLVLNLVFPVMNGMAGVATAIMVYTGALSVQQGIVTSGAWYLFLLSLDRFMFPVLNLASFWSSIQNGFSAAERVFALIDAEPAVVQADSQPVPEVKGQIDFDHVNFRYKTGEPVLEDFNLHIRTGETLALVGHTGAGKTSIGRLIARFYEFQEGNLHIDGRDVRALDLADYRRHLGIVSQAPFLFSGSVAENIRYARQEVSDAEIETLARKIGEGEWLETLPDGLQSEVGERGGRLSMGQRQLVSLMRVLVQRPAIFILDEATASIDPFTEWQIQQALNLILERTTSILIAHRLSTVKSADRIIVMENGKIIEEGNHQGLLASGGHYAMLYNTYFRHQSVDYRPPGLEEILGTRVNLRIATDGQGKD